MRRERPREALARRPPRLAANPLPSPRPRPPPRPAARLPPRRQPARLAPGAEHGPDGAHFDPMRGRWLYLLLYAVPALLAATLVAVALFGAAAGALWLFVYGDDPWPATAATTLALTFAAAWLALAAAFLATAYRFGRRREGRGLPVRGHVAAALGLTVALVLLAVSHQWGVGNIGPPSDSVRCADFCRAQGFDASGMPPRDSGAATCSCLDASGRAAVTVPIGEVGAGRRR